MVGYSLDLSKKHHFRFQMDIFADVQVAHDYQQAAQQYQNRRQKFKKRTCETFFEEMTDFEFKRTFRFTKDGVRYLTSLLGKFICSNILNYCQKQNMIFCLLGLEGGLLLHWIQCALDFIWSLVVIFKEKGLQLGACHKLQLVMPWTGMHCSLQYMPKDEYWIMQNFPHI